MTSSEASRPMRKNFIMICEVIDKMIDYSHPQIMYPEILRRHVETQVERYNSWYLEKQWSQLKLDKLKYSDSVTEKVSLGEGIRCIQRIGIRHLHQNQWDAAR